MGVEKGLDCTNANRLLIAGTEAWTSQAEVELAESEPTAALELTLAAALELGALLELALVRASSSSATAPPRSPLFLTEHRLLLHVIPSIAGGRLVGLDLSTHASPETCLCTARPGQEDLRPRQQAGRTAPQETHG